MKPLLSSVVVMMNLLIASSTTFAVPPPNGGDKANSNWYKSLKNPNTGGSCCDMADCRATDLRPDPNSNTLWQAYISKAIFGPDAPDQWVTIPIEVFLQQRDNPTGRVVICWIAGRIFCAVLPSLT